MGIVTKRTKAEANPGDSELDALCDELARDLGLFGYQWLCACAVYPGLRLPITSYVGAELARTVDRPVPDEAEHMALGRLPWFRAGWMPDALRLRLLQDLKPELRGVIRDAIEAMFHAAAQQADRPRRSESPEIVRPPRGWSRRFREWLKRAPPDAAVSDQIFVRYMMGGVTRPADLELNRRLARILGARLAGWLDRWTLLAGAATLLAVVLIAAIAGSLIRPRFDSIVNRKGTAETVRECKECPELVVLPGGVFEMGSPASEAGRLGTEGPVHSVTVPRFAMGRYPVTFDEWDLCVADGGCGGYRPDDRGWGRGRRPVINVSWNDAQAYVAWLSRKTGRIYRLPNEAEWEYAARAGTSTPYPWGNAWDPRLANGDLGRTTEVGSYPANGFGLYDVIGNVWEWTQDCWHPNYEGAPADGAAWLDPKECDRRVVRGGSWKSAPRDLRVAIRGGSAPDLREDDRGFRVSRMLTPS